MNGGLPNASRNARGASTPGRLVVAADEDVLVDAGAVAHRRVRGAASGIFASSSRTALDELLRLGVVRRRRKFGRRHAFARLARRRRIGEPRFADRDITRARRRAVRGSRLALPHPRSNTSQRSSSPWLTGLREAAVDRVLDELQAVEDDAAPSRRCPATRIARYGLSMVNVGDRSAPTSLRGFAAAVREPVAGLGSEREAVRVPARPPAGAERLERDATSRASRSRCGDPRGLRLAASPRSRPVPSAPASARRAASRSGPGRHVGAVVARTREHAEQRVVVLRGDRVELVVVAAGAGERQAEERLAEHVDLVVDPVGVLGPRIDRRVLRLAEPPERRWRGATRSSPSFGLRRGFGSRSPATCSVEELVVRQVGVERPDDVVAVAPGVGDLEVELVAVRLGVADEVEPVPAPALAVVRATRAAGRPPSRRRPATSSFRKASISSGVGGRPIRSK